MKKIVLLLAIAAASGGAATIDFTGLPANYLFSTYNGFAYATVDGVPNLLLICDDYSHTTYVPSSGLQYAVSALTGQNPLQNARFPDPAGLDASIARYETAALLVEGLRNNGPQSLIDLTAQYQYALWQLFTPSLVLPDATSQTLLSDAAAAVLTPNADQTDLYSRLRIFTPLPGYESNQEFLALAGDPSWQSVPPPDPFGGLPPPSTGDLATPEPDALALGGIGLGLIVIGPMVRRRKRQAAASSKTRIMSR